MIFVVYFEIWKYGGWFSRWTKSDGAACLVYSADLFMFVKVDSPIICAKNTSDNSVSLNSKCLIVGELASKGCNVLRTQFHIHWNLFFVETTKYCHILTFLLEPNQKNTKAASVALFQC